MCFRKKPKESEDKNKDKQEEHIDKKELVLKKGDKGKQVRELQERLNNLGYNCGLIDGIFGKMTQKALLAFQELNSLKADGIAKDEVYNKLTELENKNLTVGYRTMYEFKSYINIYQTNEKEITDIDLGERYKLESLSTIVKDKLVESKKVIAAINAQFFNMNGSAEYLGLLIDEGLWYGTPDKAFIDFIYYKNGLTKILNLHGYDKDLLSKLQRDSFWAIGTSWCLIRDGEINLSNSEYFKHSKQRNARTLLGWRKNGEFVLVTIDGRSSKSKGVTATECAQIMKLLNCYNAVNLDGGGSTEMILVDNGNIKIVNKPSDKAERKIGTAVLVYEAGD